MPSSAEPTDASRSRAARSPRRALVLLAILALAAAFRLHEIGARDVWIDEANGILIAGESLPVLLDRLRLDSSPPLYYVLLHFWIALFGDGAVALRLLSVLFSLALVAATAWAGRELPAPASGAYAALFVAVSPVQAYYSQQVRMYTLLPLLALLSVVFLVRHLREGRRGDRALWLVSTILALYTHNFALFLLPLHGVLIAASGRLRRDPGRFALAGLVVALAFAPWLPWFLAQLGNRDHYAWFLAEWERWGASGALLRSFRSFSPGAEYVLGGLSKQGTWRGVPAAVAVAVAAFGTLCLARGARGREGGAVLALWPLAFLAVPVAGALVASWLLTPSFVPGRVDQMLFPAFALLVGAGLAALSPRALRIALLVALLAVAGITRAVFHPGTPLSGRYVADGVRHEVPIEGRDRELAARIAARWRPGDVVVTTSLTRASLAYYLGRQGVPAPLLSFPRETARHLGSQNDARLLADPAALVREADAVMAEVRTALGPEGRVFLVRARARVNGPLLEDALRERHGLEPVEDLGDFSQVGTSTLVEVRVYAPAPASGNAPAPDEREALDLDARAEPEAAGPERAARRGALREELHVDRVEGGPVGDVGEEDGALHHALEARAVAFEQAADVLEGLAGLGLDPAGRELERPRPVAELPGEEQEIARAHRVREGQAEGARLRRGQELGIVRPGLGARRAGERGQAKERGERTHG